MGGLVFNSQRADELETDPLVGSKPGQATTPTEARQASAPKRPPKAFQMVMTSVTVSPRRRLAALALVALTLSQLIWATYALAQAAPPLDAPQAAAPADYRIGPLDTLEIRVLNVDELNQTTQVSATGTIVFPLIGQITAASKTPNDLAKEISGALSTRFVKNAQVSIFVKQAISQKFTVEGAVNLPGIFDLVGDLTLLQAIATARGVQDTADVRNIVVFRTVEAKRRAAVVNLADVRKGKATDPRILPGDIIVVADSGSQRAWRRIIGATPLFMIFGL